MFATENWIYSVELLGLFFSRSSAESYSACQVCTGFYPLLLRDKDMQFQDSIPWASEHALLWLFLFEEFHVGGKKKMESHSGSKQSSILSFFGGGNKRKASEDDPASKTSPVQQSPLKRARTSTEVVCYFSDLSRSHRRPFYLRVNPTLHHAQDDP